MTTRTKYGIFLAIVTGVLLGLSIGITITLYLTTPALRN